MEEIFGILLQFWWIIPIVIVRAIFVNLTKSEKKAKQSGGSGKPASPAARVNEYLERMKSELSQQGGGSSFPKPAEKPASYNNDVEDDEELLMYLKHPSSVPETPRVVKKVVETKTLVEKIDEREQAAEEQSQAQAAAAVSSDKSSFPENLDYLSPMQRAMVLSEILGPPKGMN